MTYVVAVDGCRTGWVAVVHDVDRGTLVPQVHQSFRQLLNHYSDAEAVGVDIPIGLGTGAPRACDKLARKLLQHRHVTVFSAPDKRLIDELFTENAPFVADQDIRLRALELTGRSMTNQTIRICAKIAEVNREMSPKLQQRIVEVHPEVSFCALAGHPLASKKKRVAGYEERRALLVSRLGWDVWERAEARLVAPQAAPDDLLDATVAAWTARNVYQNKETRLFGEPFRDSRGLKMEIVY